jgi:cold shock CspA family protein
MEKLQLTGTQPSRIKTGIVQYYLPDRGMGYIRDPKTREEYFFLRKHLKTSVKDKDEVRFEVGQNKQGLYAYDIKLV